MCGEFRSPTMVAVFINYLPLIYYFRRGIALYYQVYRAPVTSLGEIFTDKASKFGELLNQSFIENSILLLKATPSLRFSILSFII